MEEIVPCQCGHMVTFSSAGAVDSIPPGEYICSICGEKVVVEEEEEWEEVYGWEMNV